MSQQLNGRWHDRTRKNTSTSTPKKTELVSTASRRWCSGLRRESQPLAQCWSPRQTFEAEPLILWGHYVADGSCLVGRPAVTIGSAPMRRPFQPHDCRLWTCFSPAKPPSIVCGGCALFRVYPGYICRVVGWASCLRTGMFFWSPSLGNQVISYKSATFSVDGAPTTHV